MRYCMDLYADTRCLSLVAFTLIQSLLRKNAGGPRFEIEITASGTRALSREEKPANDPSAPPQPHICHRTEDQSNTASC